MISAMPRSLRPCLSSFVFSFVGLVAGHKALPPTRMSKPSLRGLLQSFYDAGVEASTAEKKPLPTQKYNRKRVRERSRAR